MKNARESLGEEGTTQGSKGLRWRVRRERERGSGAGKCVLSLDGKIFKKAEGGGSWGDHSGKKPGWWNQEEESEGNSVEES